MENDEIKGRSLFVGKGAVVEAKYISRCCASTCLVALPIVAKIFFATLPSDDMEGLD